MKGFWEKYISAALIVLAVCFMICGPDKVLRVNAATYESKLERKEALKLQLKDRIHQSGDGFWYYIYRNEAEFFVKARQSIIDDISEAGDDIIITDMPKSSDVVIVGRNRTAMAILAEGDIYSTYVEEGTTKTKFTIPDTIDGHSVTGVGNPLQDGYENPLDGPVDETWYAFNNFDDYDLVVVPEGVDIIFDYCFYASGFRAVSLPSTLTYIGENAFYINEQLETIDFPNSIEYIGPRAFRETPWLDKMRETSNQHLVVVNGILIDGIKAEGDVVIPQNVKVIGPWAFYGNATGEDNASSKITAVDIPDTVTEIGDYAFGACISLKKVVIGTGLKKTGRLAFGKSAVEELTLPNALVDIGGGLCYECKSLKKVTVGNNVKELGYALFARCTSLESVTLPSGLQMIGDTCFYECTSLADINIPKSVNVIDIGAFEKCSKLSKVILPEALQTLGEDAFLVNSDSSGDKIVLTIPEKMTDISELGLLDLDYVTIRVLAGGGVEKYLIDNKVPTYQTYLKGAQDIYDGTINITNNNITNNETTIIDNSTTINDNSTTINDNSTTNNINNNITDSNIENLVNAVNNETHLDSDSKADKADSVLTAGEVFVYKKMKYKVNDDEKTVSFICPDNKNVTGITIPKAVSYKDSNLKVTDINKNACKGMKKLKNVTIGANVDSIGEKAFYNCTKLKTVVIGKNVEEIGKLAFYGDKSIKKITFKNIKNLKSVGKAAFYLRSKSTDANLKAKQTSKKKMIKYLDNSGVSVSY